MGDLIPGIFCVLGQFMPFTAYQLKSYKQKNPLRYFSPINVKRGPWPNLRVKNFSKRTSTTKNPQSLPLRSTPYNNPYIGQFVDPYNLYKRNEFSYNPSSNQPTQQEKDVTGEKRQGPKYVIVENNGNSEPELYRNMNIQENFQHPDKPLFRYPMKKFEEGNKKNLLDGSQDAGFTTVPIMSSFNNINRASSSGLSAPRYIKNEYTTDFKFYEPREKAVNPSVRAFSTDEPINKHGYMHRDDFRYTENSPSPPGFLFNKKANIKPYLPQQQTPHKDPPLSMLTHVQRYELEKHGDTFFTEPERPDLMLPHQPHGVETSENLHQQNINAFTNNPFFSNTRNDNNVQFRGGVGQRGKLKFKKYFEVAQEYENGLSNFCVRRGFRY